jgi:signal-transduction protein with cAMP-binding, CBS, and nucleotidyltransferase domain
VGKAVAQSDCLLYTLTKADLELLFDQFPDMRETLQNEGQRRKDDFKKKREDIEKASPIYNKIREHFGSSMMIGKPGTSNRFVSINAFILIRDTRKREPRAS